MSRTGALLAATLSAFCWGLATVMSKGALARLPPMLLLVVQLASSIAFLWSWVLIRQVGRAAIRDALRVAWLGLLEPGLAYVLGLIGLARTQAASAALIGSSEAMIIAVLAAVLMGERLARTFLPLSAVAIAGLALATDAVSLEPGAWLGNGLILAAAVTAALYVTLSARLVGARDPGLVVACQHLVAGALALLLLPFELGRDTVMLAAVPGETWALAAASGIVQYALAFTFYLAAMRGLAASVVGAFLYLAPVVSLVGAALFLGESPSVQQMLGAAMAIGALLLLSRAGRDTRPADKDPEACPAG